MIYGKKSKDELYSCHEQNEKKRCPKCGSLETKKNGFIHSEILSERGKVKRKSQRFLCKSCGISFTDHGYGVRKKTSDTVREKAVRDYALTKSSLSEVSKRFQVSKMTILNWMNEIETLYPAIELIKDNREWSGLLTVDGKEIRIRKVRKTILVCCDAMNGKPIYYGVYDSENKQNSEAFCKQVKEIYPVEVIGITSDFGRGKCFTGVMEKVFPGIPHQICNVHFKKYVWLFLPRTKKSKYFWRNKVLKWIIGQILDASTRSESLEWLNVFKHWIPFFRASYHKRFIRSVLKNYSLLTMHLDHPSMPTTSNVSENLNRQLERKLKNTDGFKTEKSLNAFLRSGLQNID